MASGFLGIRQKNVETKDVHREHGKHNLEATRTEEAAEALVRLDQVLVAFPGHLSRPLFRFCRQTQTPG